MSFEKWEKFKLKDVIDVFIDYRGKTPAKSENGIPLITAKIVKNGRIDDPNEFIPEEDFEGWMTRGLPENGDVVLTTEAPLGEVAQINFNGRVALAQRIITMRGKNGVLDNSFLKYALQTDRMQERLSGRATGTTVTGIKSSELREVEIEFPDFSTQRRIASILTALDDKIELNRRMNETLEGIAQAVWGEWFGKYASGEEELPEGWRLGKLCDVLEIKYGKDYKHLENGTIPLYGSGGIMKYVNQAIYEKDSILIPRKGTLSNLFYVNKPFWSVDTMFYTKIKNESQGKYLFYLLKELDLASMNVGSAVPSLTTEVLNKLPIVIPAENVLEQFEKLMTSFFVKMEANISENQTLNTCRDALLPRLMSGEIDLSSQ